MRRRRSRGGPAGRPAGELHRKADTRFGAPALAALSRAFAREAALEVADEGLRWIVGAPGPTRPTQRRLERAFGLTGHPRRAGAACVADMDVVADVLYGRAAGEEIDRSER